jgi:hypothetical protein
MAGKSFKDTFTDKTKSSLEKMGRTATQQAELIKAETESWGSKVYPMLASGARAFVQVNNTPLALCLDFSYSITADYEEIRTIDNHLPYEVNINQVRIQGKLTKLINPDSSMEAEGLFHTMQSIIHQPIVEILCTDANGNVQFFCKGMFTSMETRVAMGQLTVASANFVGIQYQNWVFQNFKPYDKNSSAGGAIAKFKKMITGGLGGF